MRQPVYSYRATRNTENTFSSRIPSGENHKYYLNRFGEPDYAMSEARRNYVRRQRSNRLINKIVEACSHDRSE